MRYLLAIIFLLLVIVEGSLTTVPLVLLFLLLYAVVTRNPNVFFYAYISGLLLDVMQIRTYGTTELFFICTLFLIFIYQRKFEIATLPFVIGSLFITAFTYLTLFVHYDVWQQVGVATVIGSIIFSSISRFNLFKNN